MRVIVLFVLGGTGSGNPVLCEAYFGIKHIFKTVEGDIKLEWDTGSKTYYRQQIVDIRITT